MKFPRFEYRRAESVDEAVAALAAAGGDAKLLAGGQSLLAAMSFRLVRPSLLVDIDRLRGLDAIEASAEGLQVGALTRHADLERASLPGAWAVLCEAAACVGQLPIRVRGTLGGSVAHADPAAELVVAATALEAEVVTRAPNGGRRIPVDNLFLAPYSTVLEPAEMIVGLWFPPRRATASAAFEELTERAGDFALASVCAVVERDEEGLVSRARIALGSVGATPLRAWQAERLLEGSDGDDGAVSAAAAAAASECDPASDSHATAEYRRELVGVLTQRALRRALAAGA